MNQTNNETNTSNSNHHDEAIKIGNNRHLHNTNHNNGSKIYNDKRKNDAYKTTVTMVTEYKHQHQRKLTLQQNHQHNNTYSPKNDNAKLLCIRILLYLSIFIASLIPIFIHARHSSSFHNNNYNNSDGSKRLNNWILNKDSFVVSLHRRRKTSHKSNKAIGSSSTRNQLVGNDHHHSYKPMMMNVIRYRRSDVCTDCRYTRSSRTKSDGTCLSRMMNLVLLNSKNTTTVSSNNTISTSRLTLEEAGQYVGSPKNMKVKTFCHRCNPLSCTWLDKVYYRLDDIIVPFIEYGRIHYLQSIHPTHRISPSLLLPASSSTSTNISSKKQPKNESFSFLLSSQEASSSLASALASSSSQEESSQELLSEFLSKQENIFPKRKYLFEFNPSIIALPQNQIPILHYPTALYLASYRVSTVHNCFNDENKLKYLNGTWKYRERTYIDYLGLAVLDSNLTILQDIVVNPKQYMYNKVEDFRLFVLQDQMYIASLRSIHPIWIVPPPNATTPNVPQIEYGTHRDLSQSFEDATVLLSPYYNDSSTDDNNTDNTLIVYMRKMPSCTKDKNTALSGKNLNYFVDSNNRTMLEIMPMKEKEEIDLNMSCKIVKRQGQQKEYPPPNLIQSNQSLPASSFGTTDELAMADKNIKDALYTEERGSICCVMINDPRSGYNNDTSDNRPISRKGEQQKRKQAAYIPKNNKLLLGLSHSKTRYNSRTGAKLGNGIEANHFFSSFYVMEAAEPYNVVARSGRFCFGFPELVNNTSTSHTSNNEEGQNPYQKMRLDRLKIGDEHYDKCPSIHFVTGMTEKADDPSKIIISYGINDCISRFVVLDKEHIYRLLFHPNELLNYTTYYSSSVDNTINKNESVSTAET